MFVLLGALFWLTRLFTDYPKTNQWQQPLIKPRNGDGYVGHQRVTTLVKHVGNGGEGLSNWKALRVAVGAILRPDLRTQIQAYWNPADPDQNKDKLNEITDAMAEAAAADEKRNMGDSYHEFIRKVNQGEEPWLYGDNKEELERLIEDYKALLATAGLVVDPTWVERTVVLPDIGVAGSFDFLARKHGTGPFIVCDLKTGKRWAWKEAAQLACYANADSVYDWDTETHEDMPEVNKEIGLIVHMPPGEKPSLHVVDLVAGWEAVKVAVWMREYLKRRDVTRPARIDG